VCVGGVPYTNNLGGTGPGNGWGSGSGTGAREIRYKDAGTLRASGSAFDLVVRNMSHFSANKLTGQGCYFEFVRLKIAAGTSSRFTLAFESSDSEPIELPHFALTFYDIDTSSGLIEVLKVRLALLPPPLPALSLSCARLTGMLCALSFQIGGFEEGEWAYPNGEVVGYPRFNPDAVAASECTAADRAFLGTPCKVLCAPLPPFAWHGRSAAPTTLLSRSRPSVLAPPWISGLYVSRPSRVRPRSNVFRPVADDTAAARCDGHALVPAKGGGGR